MGEGDSSKAAHGRHVYFVESIEWGDVEGFRVCAASVAEGVPEGARRVAHDAALSRARALEEDEPVKVLVSPCWCGADGLAEYARDHPGSVVAERVRESERQDALRGS